MNNKKVSVIIPCYNAEQYVEKAVLSIMQQTYANLEIICIDDCSTDKTFEILSRLAEKDERIMLVRNEINLKLTDTLNKGVDLASGYYIARMDADDFSLPFRIEKQVDFVEKNNLKVCGTFTVFYRKGKFEKRLQIASLPEIFLLTALFDSPMIHPSVLALTDTMKKFRYIVSSQSYILEDYDLWCRMLLEKIPMGNIKEYLFVYRINELGETQSKKNIQVENHLALAEKMILSVIGKPVAIKSLRLISGLVGDFQPHWNDIKNAMTELKHIYSVYTKKFHLTKNGQAEAKSWLHWKQLYILQFGVRKGNIKTKLLSGIWFVLKSPYLVKLFAEKTLLPFNKKQMYQLL
ncbi:MAG: glycosyltransferase [Paludibacter sp.]|nr:glycosyltransferase [Paludibacter sp.]